MFRDLKENIFRRVTNILDPVFGYADIEQVFGRQLREQHWGRRRPWRFRGPSGQRFRNGCLREGNFLDPLPHFDNLCRAGLGVGFYPPTLRPFIGIVMVVNVAEQKTALCFMDDNPDVPVNPDRPEIGVFGFIDAMEFQAGCGRVLLEIINRDFCRRLLLTV